jgi:hypothetical protein
MPLLRMKPLLLRLVGKIATMAVAFSDVSVTVLTDTTALRRRIVGLVGGWAFGIIIVLPKVSPPIRVSASAHSLFNRLVRR